MKYHDEITTALLTAFLILVFAAVARLTQIKDEAVRTREAGEAMQMEMSKMARTAEKYQEWILNSTDPNVGVK